MTTFEKWFEEVEAIMNELNLAGPSPAVTRHFFQVCYVYDWTPKEAVAKFMEKYF